MLGHALGTSEVTRISACRACGARELAPVISLGHTPLANALLTADAAETRERLYPLEVVRCEACSLVQLTVSVSPEILFRRYPYQTSFSDAFVRHARDSVEELLATLSWHGDRLAVEIASNDGYLLQFYRDAGIPVLGIEPAENIAKVAQDRGIETITQFFGRDLGAQLAAQGRRADVVHANNVLAHVPDLNGVLAGIRSLLKADGLAAIETPWLCDMVDRIEFDTIYHEHLYYFSLTALVTIFAAQGLRIVDVRHLDVHGGSLRVFAQRDDAPSTVPAEAGDRVRQLLAAENEWGVAQEIRYARFADDVTQLKGKLMELLRSLRAQGRSIAAYGASAKGTTLLSYCGLTRADIEYVVDRSTIKQGMLTPGTRLPIEAPAKLLERMPDYVLLLVWNFADEVIAQQSEYRRRGGRFIIPLPDPKIV